MGLQVACTGMAQGTPPDPCVAVIFGASGDLAQNTLIPSLYALGCQGLLPNPFAIIGVARREWDDETFRDAMRDIIVRWDAKAATHLLTYAAGSWGPTAADALLRRDGRA
jgi:glucose-6-phosphate 1-dehydrogenase